MTPAAHEDVAGRLGSTPMQVAPAWLLHRWPNILLFRFPQDQQTHQVRLALGHLAINQSPCLRILCLIVADQIPDENIGIYA